MPTSVYACKQYLILSCRISRSAYTPSCILNSIWKSIVPAKKVYNNTKVQMQTETQSYRYIHMRLARLVFHGWMNEDERIIDY